MGVKSPGYGGVAQARFMRLAATYAAANPPVVSWNALTDKPATFAPSAHTHAIADITGLQTALDGKASAGSYVTTANFTWTNLGGKPTTFAPSAHTHAIADVVGLQAALDAKLSLLPVTPSTSTRAIGTAFQPSATKATLCSYSVKTQVTNPLIAGASTATVTLLSDANNPPTTERGRVAAESSVGVAVAIAITTSNTAPLTYIVPAGHYVRLVSTTTGTATTSIISQVEEALG